MAVAHVVGVALSERGSAESVDELSATVPPVALTVMASIEPPSGVSAAAAGDGFATSTPYENRRGRRDDPCTHGALFVQSCHVLPKSLPVSWSDGG